MKVGGSRSSYAFCEKAVIMIRLSQTILGLVATMAGAMAGEVAAQCSSCGTQTVFSPVIAQPQATVAFSPVVAAPTVVASPVIVQPRDHWYPGRFFDRMRMNRWGVSNATWVQPQTVAFAPSPVVQTVGFAPTATVQTVNFAPSAPYVTAYAPMQRTVVGFAPTATTAFSPAVIEPVTSVADCSACSSCATASPCSACAGGTTVVEQAGFMSPVTTVAPSGCSSCAETTGTPYYGSPSSVPPTTINAGPPTPQPELATEPPPAGTSPYDANRQQTPATSEVEKPVEKSTLAPQPMSDAESDSAVPAGGDTSTSIEFHAPPLLGPQNDRTANRPTVDVHNAVYRQPVRKATVGATTTAAKPLSSAPAAPQMDANGWYAVPDR